MLPSKRRCELLKQTIALVSKQIPQCACDENATIALVTRQSSSNFRFRFLNFRHIIAT